METAIYCRVSTEEQAQEGFSIRAQEQKLKEYVNVKDWSLFNIYIDEGISGKNITERPAVNRMIADIKAGHIKNVLVFKLDRLTRSVADLVYLIDLFKQNDCAFNSLMESLDTSTASGRMFIKIIGIFAEFERENIAERVRVGKERKTREGYTNSTNISSYGYDRENGQRIQTINGDEAENVRRIFDMYVNQGMALSAIAKSFNLQKIPTKKGCLWTANAIRSVLMNCNTMGNVRYCNDEPDRKFEAEGKHKAIISADLFNQAQILIQKNLKTAPTKKPNDDNYFASFLYCAICGNRYYPHLTNHKTVNGVKKVTYAFQCRERSLKGNCNSKGIVASKVEAALIEYITHFEDVFQTDSAENEKQEKREAAAQAQIYRDKLRRLDNKEKEIMSHYTNDEIDFDSYRGMKKQIDSDRTFLQAELDKLCVNEDTRPATMRHEEIIANFRENWENLTNTEKRLFLTNYIKKIIVSNEPVEGSRYGNTKVIDIEFSTY